jgi:hypothetical protein
VEDDDDVSGMWRDHHKARQEKRGENRDASQQLLQDHGVAFEVKNGGAHLIVKGDGSIVDFWPGTGLWLVRESKPVARGRGVFNLLKRLGKVKPS